MSEPRLAAPAASSQVVSGDQGWTLDASGDRTMSLSQPSYRDEVENTYLTLEQNFDTLYQQCSTADQKRQLSDLHSVARYAFWKAGEQARPDEGGVGATFQDLKMVNMKLNAMLKNLDDIGAFLSLAEEAVRLAESLTPPPADA